MQSKRGAAESGKSLDPTASGTTAVSVASGACTGGGPEKCSVCAKFRLALRGGAFFHSNEVLDLDYGWFNIVANESEEDYLVDEAIVTDTVEKAQEHATRVRKQLSQYGLLNHYSQIYSGETTRARIVAVRVSFVVFSLASSTSTTHHPAFLDVWPLLFVSISATVFLTLMVTTFLPSPLRLRHPNSPLPDPNYVWDTCSGREDSHPCTNCKIYAWTTRFPRESPT